MNTSVQARADVADKNAKAAIIRINELDGKLAKAVNTLQGMEKTVIGLQQDVVRLTQQINLTKAQTSYTQIEQRILPKIMAELEACKED